MASPFKILLGIAVSTLGLSMFAAGWVTITQGQWSALINAFIGFAFGFMGVGFIVSGVMLMRGSTVKEALGGMVVARSGHSGVGLHKGMPHRTILRNF